MSRRAGADSIVRRQVAWSCAVGLLPSELFSAQRLNVVQLELLEALSDHYDVEYTAAQARRWLVGLNASFMAKLAVVAVDVAPGINAIVGGVSRSALCGTSTYALGQIAIAHFEANGTLDDLDLALAKEAYERGLARGRASSGDPPSAAPATGANASTLQAREVLDKLERLTRLHARGVIGDEDFEAMRRELLDRT